MEPFTLIEESGGSKPHHLFDDFVHLCSGKNADHDIQYVAALRAANPGTVVTAIPEYNVSLRAFAAAGYASCELDKVTDSFASWRGYQEPPKRMDRGYLAESVFFAKYHYKWANEDFVFYNVGGVQYVVKECRDDEIALGPSKATDALIQAIGEWMKSILDIVWVYDGYWTQSRSLYDQVMKSSWDNVILDESMKKNLTEVTSKFFSSKSIYEDLGVPWKRGLLFHGPPGNGKTISIRALMHTLYTRKDPIPTLYVKSAPYTYDINQVFSRARALAPCMLILEDIETIVTPDTRSYFFNEMDGLENNDGLFVVASTNFLDRLDPGLSKRPSRFDRKYLFPLPNEHERTLYCEYWRRKLKRNKSIDFPGKLCPAMAHITSGFSFAFLQECFVATLLVLARDDFKDGSRPFDSDNDDLDDYEMWTTFKKQAEILRKEVEGQKASSSQLMDWCKSNVSSPVEATSEFNLSAPHRYRSYQHKAPPTGAMGGLSMKDNGLPKLHYGKYEAINSAAFELKPY